MIHNINTEAVFRRMDSKSEWIYISTLTTYFSEEYLTLTLIM